MHKQRLVGGSLVFATVWLAGALTYAEAATPAAGDCSLAAFHRVGEPSPSGNNGSVTDPKAATPAEADALQRAGGGSEAGTPAAAAPEPAAQEDDDLSIDKAQPDFTVITLPTTLRMPLHKAAFRVTHRFARPLGQGSLGDLVDDFFGFDSGAQIGLEVRFGLARGLQVGLHRTSDRTLQFFGQYSLFRQQGSAPLGLALMAAVEGLDNFRKHRVPTLGIVLSRTVGDRLALYASPYLEREPADSDGGGPAHEAEHTLTGGFGARIRILSATYLVGEIAPRFDAQGVAKHHLSFGLEKRVGGHTFQVNVSNDLGTTFAQVARGATNYDNWFIGFNISRKFF